MWTNGKHPAVDRLPSLVAGLSTWRFALLSISIAAVLSYLLGTRRESHLTFNDSNDESLCYFPCLRCRCPGRSIPRRKIRRWRWDHLWFFKKLTTSTSPIVTRLDAWEKRWIQSTNKGETAGKFVLTHGKFYGDAEKDLGIQTSEDARFYGLSTKFQAFSNKDSPVVIQFTVKHEQNIDCGGGYVKLFDCNLAQEDMHGDSPYLIMFGMFYYTSYSVLTDLLSQILVYSQALTFVDPQAKRSMLSSTTKDRTIWSRKRLDPRMMSTPTCTHWLSNLTKLMK